MKKLTACFCFLFLATLVGILLSGFNPVSAASLALATTGTPVTVAATSTTTITPTKTSVAPAATSVVTPTQTSVPPTATSVATPTATLPKPTATQVVTPTAKATTTVTATKTATVTATATKTPTQAPTATPTKPKALAPRAGTPASLSTMFVLQNMDPSVPATSVTANFYDPSGTISGTVTVPTINPYFNAVIDQRTTGGGLGGLSNWQGSVVLSSNTQLAAVVDELAGSSLGTDFRMDSYNGAASSDAGTSVLLPQLLKMHLDPLTGKSYNSTIAIQNTNAITPANVIITYTSRTGTIYTHSGISVPPSTSYFVDLQNESVLPAYDPVAQTAFYGSGTVTSDQPIAVIVNHNAQGVLNVYQGYVTSAITANTLYVPQVMKNHADNGYVWSTSILVMTTAPNATVTVTYTERGTGRKFVSTQVANPAYSFDARYDPPLAGVGDFFASAVVSANQPIVAIQAVWTNPESRGQRSKYARPFAAGSGTSTVFFSQVRKNALDSGSGLNFGTSAVGMVLSGVPTTVTCTYYLSGGTTKVSTFSTSSSDPLFYFDSRYDTNLPDGATGAAVITTSNGAPIAVTGHIFGSNFGLSSGDTEGSFFGVNK